MKKFFAAAVIALVSLTASAQTPEQGEVSLTPMLGVSYGGYMNYEFQGGFETPSRNGQIGFTVGAELGYMSGTWFKPSIGVQYINASTQLKITGDKVDIKNDYLAIPVLANFYFSDGFAFKVGVQPAFLLSAKFDGEDNKDCVNSFDFTIPVGLSYEFNNIVLDARYNIGLQNSIKSDCKTAGFTNLTNGYATITVGYKFSL